MERERHDVLGARTNVERAEPLQKPPRLGRVEIVQQSRKLGPVNDDTEVVYKPFEPRHALRG